MGVAVGRNQPEVFHFMARPVKNNCDYFPHDRDMRDHKKIKAVRSKFGIMGFGVWVMILEYLTGNDGNVFEYSDIEFELMSGDFGVTATEIRSVVDYCISLELLFNVAGFVKSESLDERLLPVYEKRGKAKELSKKQQRTNGKFTANNPVVPVVSVAETPQSKVKESTVNETKVKEIIPADFEEKFLVAFDELTCESYSRAFRHLSLGRELELFKLKCDNDKQSYYYRDAAGLRTAFLYQLKNSKDNGKPKSGNLADSFDRIDQIIDQQNNP